MVARVQYPLLAWVRNTLETVISMALQNCLLRYFERVHYDTILYAIGFHTFRCHLSSCQQSYRQVEKGLLDFSGSHQIWTLQIGLQPPFYLWRHHWDYLWWLRDSYGPAKPCEQRRSQFWYYRLDRVQLFTALLSRRKSLDWLHTHYHLVPHTRISRSRLLHLTLLGRVHPRTYYVSIQGETQRLVSVWSSLTEHSARSTRNGRQAIFTTESAKAQSFGLLFLEPQILSWACFQAVILVRSKPRRV